MHIVTPEIPDAVLFDGAAADQRFDHQLLSGGGASALHISIGQPVQWSEGTFLGDDWKPPFGDYRYFLVRFAFSVRPLFAGQVRKVDFGLSIEGSEGAQGFVFDAYPVEQIEDVKRPVTLGISPSVKFGPVDASLASVSTTIDFGHPIPIIRTDGLSEPKFWWHYEASENHPLSGFRAMYAVIALPATLPVASVQLELVAEADAYVHWVQKALFGTKGVSEKLRWAIGTPSTPAPLPANGDGNIEWDFLYHDTSLQCHLPSSFAIRAFAKKDQLISATLITWTGNKDDRIPMLKLGEEEVKRLGIWDSEAGRRFPSVALDVWQGITPARERGGGQYYRIQVESRCRTAFLKARNLDGHAYQTPNGQFVREIDIPDQDNYELPYV